MTAREGPSRGPRYAMITVAEEMEGTAMKHVRATSRVRVLSAFTINLRCVPCILIGRLSGKGEDDILAKCEAKTGGPCVT